MKFKNNLILFGGIHDITHELDDIYIYKLDKNEWVEIEKNTQLEKAEATHSFSIDKKSHM